MKRPSFFFFFGQLLPLLVRRTASCISVSFRASPRLASTPNISGPPSVPLALPTPLALGSPAHSAAPRPSRVLFLTRDGPSLVLSTSSLFSAIPMFGASLYPYISFCNRHPPRPLSSFSASASSRGTRRTAADSPFRRSRETDWKLSRSHPDQPPALFFVFPRPTTRPYPFRLVSILGWTRGLPIVLPLYLFPPSVLRPFSLSAAPLGHRTHPHARAPGHRRMHVHSTCTCTRATLGFRDRSRIVR